MKVTYKRLAKLAVFGLVAALIIPAIAYAAVRRTPTQAPSIIAVKFHADWCGSCKALTQPLRDLENKFDRERVLFVTLDFTNSTTTHQANQMAKTLGIERLVKRYNGKTGFVLLIDANRKIERARLDKKMTVKQMTMALKIALKAAQQRSSCD